MFSITEDGFILSWAKDISLNSFFSHPMGKLRDSKFDTLSTLFLENGLAILLICFAFPNFGERFGRIL